MAEYEDERVAPRSIRGYLKEIRETGRIYRWIWREFDTTERKKWLYRVMFTLIVMTFLHALQPWLVKYIYDGLIERESRKIFLGLGAFLVLASVLVRWSDYYHGVSREWLMGINWRRLDERITELFFEKSLGQHMQESSRLNVGNIDKARWKIVDLQAMVFFEASEVMLSLLVSLVLLWVLSPVSGAVMTFVIATYLGWLLFLNQRVLEVCVPIDKDSRALNRYRYERWEKIERVKVSAKCEEELDGMNLRFDALMERDRGFWIWFIKMVQFRGLTNDLGLAAIMAYGAWKVWTGEAGWSLGLLYPLYSWSSRVAENIWRIGQIEHQLNWNMPALRSMIEALSIKPDVVDRKEAFESKRSETVNVSFENVSHVYPKGGKEEVEDGDGSPVLKHVSFTIAPGEKVALVGPSGAGKTTIMRLLLRFMDPDEGRILINGRDLRDVKLTSWMRCIGYISQQAQILDGTIRYNLTYSLTRDEREAMTDEELWRIMRSLKIDFGKRLSNGLETRVGRNGIKLSGGEAQRLMIGAAVIGKPPFMLIDEATSSLDSSTERAVQAGLAEVLSGSTSALVIAHRLSTVRHLCTKFVILRPAEEVNSDPSQVEAIGGSFEELFKLSPTFRRLAADQGIKE